MGSSRRSRSSLRVGPRSRPSLWLATSRPSLVIVFQRPRPKAGASFNYGPKTPSFIVVTYWQDDGDRLHLDNNVPGSQTKLLDEHRLRHTRTRHDIIAAAVPTANPATDSR